MQKIVFILKNEKKIFLKASFSMKLKRNDNKEIKKEKEKIFLSIFFDLRDLVQLFQKETEDEKVKENYDNCRKFVEIIYKINNIYDALKALFISGNPELIEIKIKIANCEFEYIRCGLKTNNYRELVSKLLNMLDELKEAQIKAYKEKPLIRFIYGIQLNLIYDSIKEKEVDKNKKKIIPLLVFLANDSIEYKDIN